MAKTKGELISMIENDLVDSTSQKITGASVKNVMLEMVETMAESAGSGGAMEYWSVPSYDVITGLGENGEVIIFATLGKIILDGTTMAVPMSVALEMGDILAFAWDNNLRAILNNNIMTLGKLLTAYGVNFEDAGFVKITEEEFYTI